MSEKKSRFSRDSLEPITSEHFEAIVQAAEQAAAKVIDDAEVQALQYLADARVEGEAAYQEKISSLSAATDSLMAQVEEIRHRADRLLDSLEEVRASLGTDAGNGNRNRRATDSPSPRGSHLSAVAPVREPEGISQSHPVRESPARARLLATQMAVSGSSREEIAARLRNDFEIEDTDSILDAILGPED